MKNQAVLFLVIGLLVGVAGTAVVMRNRAMGMGMTLSDTMPGMNMSSSPMATGSSMSMADMMAGLQGKTGDSFDQAFISEMMMHHQGAIDMATLAAAQARHQEIKNLAKGIISAQTSEIAQMRQWQKNWGYTQ